MNKTLMHCLIPVTLGVMTCGAPDPQSARPNVLIVLADDMGYGDPGCYGGLARTPTLDALARNGIRFTGFYAGALYQSAGTYDQHLNNASSQYSTRVDFANQSGMRAGMTYRF